MTLIGVDELPLSLLKVIIPDKNKGKLGPLSAIEENISKKLTKSTREQEY